MSLGARQASYCRHHHSAVVAVPSLRLAALCSEILSRSKLVSLVVQQPGRRLATLVNYLLPALRDWGTESQCSFLRPRPHPFPFILNRVRAQLTSPDGPAHGVQPYRLLMLHSAPKAAADSPVRLEFWSHLPKKPQKGYKVGRKRIVVQESGWDDSLCLLESCCLH